MNEIKVSGSIHNIRATGSKDISFEIGQEDGGLMYVIENTKAAVLYSLLMEGDSVNVTGIMTECGEMLFVRVTGLDRNCDCSDIISNMQ